MSVSQFASDNNVYFEFYPKYCLVRDILTGEALLQGDAVKGLYKFNLVKFKNFGKGEKCYNFSVVSQAERNMSSFDICHYKLYHANASILKKVLTNNKISFENTTVHILSNGQESQTCRF